MKKKRLQINFLSGLKSQFNKIGAKKPMTAKENKKEKGKKKL